MSLRPGYLRLFGCGRGLGRRPIDVILVQVRGRDWKSKGRRITRARLAGRAALPKAGEAAPDGPARPMRDLPRAPAQARPESTATPATIITTPPHCAQVMASRRTMRASSTVTAPKPEPTTTAISAPGPWLPASSAR